MKTNWYMENEFPHVITKNKSENSIHFESLNEAFVHRQEISNFYNKEYLNRTAYDRFLEAELKALENKI